MYVPSLLFFFFFWYELISFTDEKNDRIKQTIKGKLEEYITRAEQLKGIDFAFSWLSLNITRCLFVVDMLDKKKKTPVAAASNGASNGKNQLTILKINKQTIPN